MKFVAQWMAAAVVFLASLISRADDGLVSREWTVDGLSRTASIYALPSAKANLSPVIFAFHGHGGTISTFEPSFRFTKFWPEAIVVYMQGVNTPGRLTDLEGKRPGWQAAAGDNGDRDLKFFDAVLADLKKDYRVDEKRIYATGFSNGGGFTYVLWENRGDIFAAVAPAAGVPTITHLPHKPKPVLQIAGRADPLVKFEWQQQTLDYLRGLNQCGDGEPWGNATNCTLYPSKIGAPVVTCFHAGAHRPPAGATELIVKFFKEHQLP